MAYVDDENLDDQNSNKSASDASSPQLSSGGSEVLTGGSASAPNQSGDTASKPTSSGSWTNLRQYLDANNDQAGQLASTIGGKISNEASDAQGSLKSLNDSYTGQVNSSGTSLNQDVINQAVSDPTSVANDNDKFNAFETQLNSKYAGPTDLTQYTGYDQVTGKYNQAKSDLDLSNSESGRQTLLQNTYARPDYNQGEKSLDQLLLEGNPNSQQTFSDLRSKYSGLMDQLGIAQTSAQQLAQQRAQDTQAANQAAYQALYGDGSTNPGAIASAKSVVDQKLAAAQKARQSQYNGAYTELNSNQIEDSLLSQLGLSNGQAISNLHLENYLDPSAIGTLSRNDVATAEDAAKFSALSKLAGNTDLAGYVSPSGTPLSNPVSFNLDKFNRDLAEQQASYQSAMNSNYGSATPGSRPMDTLQNLMNVVANDSNHYATGSTANFYNYYLQQINAVRAQYGLGPVSKPVGPDGIYQPGLVYGADRSINQRSSR